MEKIKPVIFCGDLNIAHTPDDLARPKENEGNKGYTKEEREGFQIMEKERNVWMEIAKNLTIIVEAWQLRWMEANEQRIIEKSENI